MRIHQETRDIISDWESWAEGQELNRSLFRQWLFREGQWPFLPDFSKRTKLGLSLLF